MEDQLFQEPRQFKANRDIMGKCIPHSNILTPDKGQPAPKPRCPHTLDLFPETLK
jgi:hypothetical protein